MGLPTVDYAAAFAAAQQSKPIESSRSITVPILVKSTTLTPTASAAVVANRLQRFRFEIAYTVSAITVGVRLTLNGPTFSQLNYHTRITQTGMTSKLYDALGKYGDPLSAHTSSAGLVGNFAIIEGIIRPTVDGDLVAMVGATGPQVTILPGSNGVVETI